MAAEAHRRGAGHIRQMVILGDGAAWIWNLAGQHFPEVILSLMIKQRCDLGGCVEDGVVDAAWGRVSVLSGRGVIVIGG